MKKTTPQNLNKRLVQYGALTAAITGIIDANGQVGGPTDPDPDIDIVGTIGLDMDGDGNDDFEFINNSSFLFVQPVATGAEIIGSSQMPASTIYRYPYALASSAIISNSASGIWFNNSYQSMNASSTYGNWVGVTDRFLGLRFQIAGQTHYGWARLDVMTSPGSGVTLKEYYYNPNPNQAIQAGQTATLDIKENVFENTKIVALNKTIALYNLPQRSKYELYNVSGQTVTKGEINSNSHTIEAKSVANSMYIFVIEDINTGAVLKKKIIL